MVTMRTFNSRDEWLEGRSGRIGGSEASAIVGMNPYQTNVELWEVKTGRAIREDISDKPYVKYGTEAEKHLRDLFTLDFPQYKVDYIENNMWFNDKYPFAHASLDGWMTDKDGRRGILEIKTTNILQSMQREKWDHRIPSNYYVQVLWYLAVTEFDFAILKAQLKAEYADGEVILTTKHYYIDRREVKEDIDYLMKSAEKFYECMAHDIKPNLVLPVI